VGKKRGKQTKFFTGLQRKPSLQEKARLANQGTPITRASPRGPLSKATRAFLDKEKRQKKK